MIKILSILFNRIKKNLPAGGLFIVLPACILWALFTSTDLFSQYSIDDINRYREAAIKSQTPAQSQTDRSGLPQLLPQTVDTRPLHKQPPGKQFPGDTLKGVFPYTNQMNPYEPEPYSYVEKIYNSRLEVSEPLRQYGYDFFKREIPDNFLPVGGSYTVGPGDTISVYFWGDPVDILGLNGFYTITVDRDGKIFIPNVGVFYVWGLELSRIKDIIHGALSKKFKRFDIALTLGQLRQFPVYVAGYVANPGLVQSLGTYTVMDVIVQAGGIAKNGSLRNVEIVRKDSRGEKRISIDFYGLFLRGEQVNIQVKEGDSIVVNPIGRTVAVVGDVKRPAIYEVSDTQSVSDLIEYSGGLLFSAYTANAKKLSYSDNKVSIHEGALTRKEFLARNLLDGDCLIVQSAMFNPRNEILVAGHVRYPGRYAWHDGLKLSDIIKKAELLPDTYAESGDIKRVESGSVLSFVPSADLSGDKDIALNERDIVTFYPRWLFNPMQISGEVEESKLVPYYRGITLLDAMKQIKLTREPALLKVEIYETGQPVPADNELPVTEKPERLPVDPGRTIYPLQSDSSKAIVEIEPDMLSQTAQNPKQKTAAGSLPEEEKKSIIYLQDLLVKGDEASNILLKPGSKLIIKTVESNEKNKTITLLGEVKKPGIYNYLPGMKISDLIEMAGGYTDIAYPRGLIFNRKSAHGLQLAQIKLAMIAMEEFVAKSSAGLASMGGSEEEKMAVAMAMTQQKTLQAIIEKKSRLALGRIALDLPYTQKELAKAKDNIILVEDDYILVPAKPNYVLVLGNVYNQISVPHAKGKSIGNYLDDVGGPAKDSDLDSIYVIKANGKIVTRNSYDSSNGFFLSFFMSFDNMKLEEGDAVVVPFEVNIPIMWRPILRDITQIMFQSVSTLVLADSMR